ncbi:MAG TPA: histidinol-phosphate transaminase [Candidatus Limnocylindria bacterium]|nr:histidinol-phosphate transaminase [Candidatus Limnocylindria bacterium]
MGERRVAPVEHGGAPRGWLDFSANLNPCGVPAGVRAAVASARYDTYADLSQESATRRLARASGIRSDHAVLTAGATEGLRLAAALLEPGDRALVIGPTYGEYARLARSRGALVEELRASAPSFRVPARELLRRIATDAPRLVFLCDPNNPTGARVAPVALTALVDVLPRRTVLVVDQSFLPFAGSAPSAADLVKGGNVVLVRSLTKVLGAAGLRLGYLIARPALLARLADARDPWAVGSHACAAAAVAAWELPREVRHAVRAWRSRLRAGLHDRGLEPLHSVANFVLVRVGPCADALVAALAARRIAVRGCASFCLPEHVRIAVRPPEEQDELFRALDRARREVRW